jgi:hypothetical protein
VRVTDVLAAAVAAPDRVGRALHRIVTDPVGREQKRERRQRRKKTEQTNNMQVQSKPTTGKCRANQQQASAEQTNNMQVAEQTNNRQVKQLQQSVPSQRKRRQTDMKNTTNPQSSSRGFRLTDASSSVIFAPVTAHT